MAYGTFKILHALHMGYYWVPTGSNGSNDPFESSVLGVIDNPAAVLVFIHLVDLGIELRLAIQAIPFPELLYLTDNLLPVWISALPFDGGMEPVGKRVDLKAGGVVDPLSPGEECQHVRSLGYGEGQ